MRVIIDIDGVCANLITIWLKKYNRDYGDTLKVSDIKDWNLDQFTKPECGTKIYHYLSNPKLYNQVKPIPLAKETIEFFRELQFEIIYVTNAAIGSEGRKLRWLKDYNFFCKGDHYIETSSKFLINADLIIDDYIKNLENFNGMRILYRQPWNEHIDFPVKMNWQEIQHDLKKYKGI